MKKLIKLLEFRLILMIVIVLFTAFSGSEKPLPIPNTPSLLFYLQRSHNFNTIVYDLNTYPNGSVNKKNPVHPYWIRYEEGGVVTELSYIQLNYAYGVTTSCIENGKETLFVVNLVCYKHRSIYLFKNKNKKYRAYILINGKMAELTRIYFRSEGNSFWFPLVNYVNLYGKNPITGEEVMEHFIP